MLKKVSTFFVSDLLGILFLLSAWFKLFPIEPFEYQIAGSTFFGWDVSVFVARFVIGIEFFLGVLLLFAYDLKRTIPLMSALLILFCIHLSFLLISRGNEVDCGCMGTLMAFTPAEGLIKNALMLFAGYFLYRSGYRYTIRVPYATAYVLVVSIASVFILNPVDLGYASAYLNKPFERFDLNLDTLYHCPDSEKVAKPVADVRNSKTVLAFLSASCPHCKIAASKIGVMHRLNPSIPFYFFVNGDPKDIERFLIKTETSDIPNSRLNGRLFVQSAGLNLPVIYYYNKGFVDLQVDYFTLDQSHIESWLKKP